MKRAPFEYRLADGTIRWVCISGGPERRHAIRRQVSPLAFVTACGKRVEIRKTWNVGKFHPSLVCSNCERAVGAATADGLAEALAS